MFPLNEAVSKAIETASFFVITDLIWIFYCDSKYKSILKDVVFTIV